MASLIVNPPSCSPGFDWMNNREAQGPCTVAAWLIEICQDQNSPIPAALNPLTETNANYLPPNGTSATLCSCSWALYNTLAACTVCQDHNAQQWSSWSSSCNLAGLTSTTTYWPSSFSFSNVTQLPQWSIFNPTLWNSETFNAAQAQEIDNQNLPDVTNSSASQPTISSESSSSKKAPVGAIAGGVVGGVLGLAALGLLLWYLLYRRRLSRMRPPRKHVDLAAEGGERLGSPGPPLSSHLLHSFNADFMHPYHQSTMQQVQGPHVMHAGYPLTPAQIQAQAQSQGATQPVPGIMRSHPATRTQSRESNAIPTVAEQLDEKRRIRAEHQRNGSSGGGSVGVPSAYQYPGAESSSRLSNASQGNNTVAISHSQSHLFANRGEAASRQGSSEAAVSTTPAPARRASIIKVPWHRTRVVANPSASSDGGSVRAQSPRLLPTRLPSEPNAAATAAAAAVAQTNPVSDLVARIPGARLPSARERENPPPVYTTPSRTLTMEGDHDGP